MRTLAILITALLVAGAAPAHARDVRVHTGVLDGARYRVEVPSDWNGTLLLYNHGVYSKDYVPEEIELTNRPEAKPRLLDEGYALAASLYTKPYGFSGRQAVRDQTALLEWFDRNVGRPGRVLTWGASGGGLYSVLLSQRLPHRIDGVLAMCGPVGGAQALFNQLLDLGFTIRTLLAPELELVDIEDPAANLARARQVLTEALRTPQGRARLALAGAFADVPGWSRTFGPRPEGLAEQVRQQARYVQLIYAALAWGDLRTDLEEQASGNPSGNVGVDYRRLLTRSSERELVRRAYREAGLDLSADLATLADAPRIAAEPRAVSWLVRHGTPGGWGRAPIVTLHPVGDAVPPEHERTFASKVAPHRLRQLYVNRGGHCQHTAAEELTALRVLRDRVEIGRWPTTSPSVLNEAAGRFAPEFHALFDWIYNEQGTSMPAFTRHQPRPLPRVS